eukprot:4148344-Prymnesium_polylepis.1
MGGRASECVGVQVSEWVGERGCASEWDGRARVGAHGRRSLTAMPDSVTMMGVRKRSQRARSSTCLLYTSDAADDM